jgi:hypothetical protein
MTHDDKILDVFHNIFKFIYLLNNLGQKYMIFYRFSRNLIFRCSPAKNCYREKIGVNLEDNKQSTTTVLTSLVTFTFDY